ncbi:MAG: DJ-1 family glyoxalase III [Eubacteriales bacterium]|jgi:4-methyl-5(b-hydroxyethyl)-thiazole monophosphate biosynthesis
MVLEFLADGFEEMEAMVPCDYLRRCGVDVRLVGVTGRTVTGSHGVPFVCDQTLEEISLEQLEGIILPGGMPGTTNLYDSEQVRRIIGVAAENNLLVSAICAAPSILGKMGLLRGKKAICFPGFEATLLDACVISRPVVVDGNFITSKGAGTALEFAYELAVFLRGKDKAQEIGEQIQWNRKF